MTAGIIDGETLANTILEQARTDAATLKQKGRPAHLHAVQVGDNPANKVYVRNQKSSCEAAGINYTLDVLPDDATQEELETHLYKLNASPECTGIILQMPLPDGIDRRRAQSCIAAGKDVEGVGPTNLGTIIAGTPYVGPCTALAAVELIFSLNLQTDAIIPEGVEHGPLTVRNVRKPIFHYTVGHAGLYS